MESEPTTVPENTEVTSTEPTATTEPVPENTETTNITLEDLTQEPLQNPIKEPLTDEADTVVINEELKELYETVSEKIRLAVAHNQFTPEILEIILAKIVETLEEISKAGAKNLTGIEKRNIGINLLRLVMKDLHEAGQIDDQTYSYFNLSISYAAPLMFYAAKEAWKKLNEISDDIAQKGCAGCFSRNCC